MTKAKTVVRPGSHLPFIQDTARRRFYWPQGPESSRDDRFYLEGKVWAVDLAEWIAKDEGRHAGTLTNCVVDALGLDNTRMPLRLHGMLWMTSQLAAAVIAGMGSEQIRAVLTEELADRENFVAGYLEQMRAQRCANLEKARAAKAAKRAAMV